MVDKGSVVDRGLVENGDMVDTVGNMVGDGRAMETIMMEGGMVNSMGANSIIDSMSNRKAIFEYVLMANPHWDFLPKFLSLHYYSTLEGVLGVQRRGQAQGTIICLFGPLFFSQNGMAFKKPTKIIKIQWKVI